MESPDGRPVIAFATSTAWREWLVAEHVASDGIWVQLAKKSSGIESIRRHEAVEQALCFGWIDGQARSAGDDWFLQRFTPRRKRSKWSRLMREKALELIESAGRRERGRPALLRRPRRQQSLRDPAPHPRRQARGHTRAPDREVRRDARAGRGDPPLAWRGDLPLGAAGLDHGRDAQDLLGMTALLDQRRVLGAREGQHSRYATNDLLKVTPRRATSCPAVEPMNRDMIGWSTRPDPKQRHGPVTVCSRVNRAKRGKHSP